MKYSFEIPGPLVGAVRTTQRAKYCDPRYKRYAEFKERVRLLANCAGVPEEIPDDIRVYLLLRIDWAGKPRCDLDNAVKSILDACFAQDRRVYGIDAFAYEDTCGEDIAHVEFEFTKFVRFTNNKT